MPLGLALISSRKRERRMKTQGLTCAPTSPGASSRPPSKILDGQELTKFEERRLSDGSHFFQRGILRVHDLPMMRMMPGTSKECCHVCLCWMALDQLVVKRGSFHVVTCSVKCAGFAEFAWLGCGMSSIFVSSYACTKAPHNIKWGKVVTWN